MAQDSEVKVSEFVEARQMPRPIFEQLPEIKHDEALTYLGWVDESINYWFIAEQKKGEFVRVDGESVWDSIASQWVDSEGNLTDGCHCCGTLNQVKREFRGFRERLPRIVLKKERRFS